MISQVEFDPPIFRFTIDNPWLSFLNGRQRKIKRLPSMTISPNFIDGTKRNGMTQSYKQTFFFGAFSFHYTVSMFVDTYLWSSCIYIQCNFAAIEYWFFINFTINNGLRYNHSKNLQNEIVQHCLRFSFVHQTSAHNIISFQDKIEKKKKTTKSHTFNKNGSTKTITESFESKIVII